MNMFFAILVLCSCSQFLSLVAVSESVQERSFEECAALLENKRIPGTGVNMRNETRSKNESNENVSKFETIASVDQLDFINAWYTNVPLLPIMFANSPTMPDGPCKRQAQRYLHDLKNGTLWATRMFDSSTKYPDGLLSGHRQYFGDFDGCYDLKVKLPVIPYNYEDTEITGRYCLVDLKYEKRDLSPLKNDIRHELEFDPNDSVWEAIREKGDIRRGKRYLLQMALCVPEVCHASDIEAALRGPIEKFSNETNLNVQVSVKSHFCQARKDAPEFSKGAKIYCCILAGLISMVIASTYYDFTSETNNEKVTSMKRDLILCFSARRNFNTLMGPPTSHRGLETLPFIRFALMIFVIMGHRTTQYYIGPVINLSNLELIYTFKASMMLLAGTLVVESFFSMSGLLLTYILLVKLDAKKNLNFPVFIISRFIRLTPSYMVIVFFNALVLPYLGSGPYWEWKVGLERDGCSNNWWTNFLYINNYVNTEMLCMFQTWYVAVDFQLSVIGLFAVYVFWRMPRKIGYLFIFVILLASCIIPFVNTYYYNIQPIYMGLLDIQELRGDPYFTGHYVKTHERLTSYFIGILVGAIIYDHGRAPWKLGKISSNILFILLVVVGSLGTQIAAHKYYDPNAHPTILNKALYACLCKGCFAIATCAIPALITIGDGLDFHYKFFTPRWIQPLAKLTYGAYLIHSAQQLYDIGTMRSALTFTFRNIIWDLITETIYTFSLSLLLSLTVEIPLKQLKSSFTARRQESTPSDNSNKEDTLVGQEKKKIN